MDRSYSVYILSNRHRTVFYTGITGDLEFRLWQHRNRQGGAFTSKYQCCDLLYVEEHAFVLDAIDREKQIKRWGRAKKVALIRTINPEMVVLSGEE